MQTTRLLHHPWHTHTKNGYGSESPRRATALLLKMSTFELTEHDSETQESTERRLTCKKVIWKDMILPLVSMYVPVNPAARKTFLKKISNNKRSIPPGAIIGGDFNCVENITFDTLKEDGGIYQNHHGGVGVVTTMMRRKKLSDVFRKIHGNTARAYTRESATVRTRLDRNIGYTHKTKIVK